MKRLLAASAIVLMAASPGTVKVDGDDSLPDNDPHVCAPDVRSWMSDSTTFTVRSWPPTGDGTVVLSGTTDGPELTLPNGHYKLDTATGKSKVFWVECPAPTTPPQQPPVTPTGATQIAPVPSAAVDIPLPETDTVGVRGYLWYAVVFLGAIGAGLWVFRR